MLNVRTFREEKPGWIAVMLANVRMRTPAANSSATDVGDLTDDEAIEQATTLAAPQSAF